MIAEACNPEWVSVPLVGWSHYRALSRVCKAHLVTQIRNRDALLRAGLIEGTDFTAIDSEKVAAPIHKLAGLLRGGAGKGWTTKMALSALAQPYFERVLWQRFSDRLKAGEFDVVHQLTPLSPTLPARTAKRCGKIGVPFAWGPLNGGVPWPKEFDAARRQEKEWLTYVRGIYKLLPGYRSTRKHARAILIGSRDTFSQMPVRYHSKCFYVPENAIEPQRFAKRRARRAGDGPVRAIFVGRLVPYKGADMLIEAAAPLIKAGRLTIDVIGDGPDMASIKKRIETDHLAGVRLAGWVKHTEVQNWLAGADVFTFPSIREFGGGVALEAMAVGLPCLVPDYGGLGELVTDASGWKLPMGDRATLVTRLRDQLTALCDDPARIDQKGDAAYERAHSRFTWDVKARQTLSIYRWMLGRVEKPHFD